jgi:hypothetical protein
VGILWDRTEEYRQQKAKLSPQRQAFLDDIEEDIAANPDVFRFESKDGVRYRLDFEGGVLGFVAFEFSGRTKGLLIEFAFLDQA